LVKQFSTGAAGNDCENQQPFPGIKEAGMNQPRALGPATLAGGSAAAGGLPVTGSNTFAIIIAGLLLIVVGLLLVRSARLHRAQG
jgi:LPXTG-motif cell wall-anchored protein